jgi:hypothetical protein
MDIHTELEADCSPAALFAWVDDLVDYPAWMRLVHRVEPAEPVDGDTGPAWDVELRARLGPLARSKRLRMVRTELVATERVVFARAERDGRTHSPWVLTATVGAQPSPLGGSLLDVHLHYGGGLWGGGLLERALTEEIQRGRTALVALVASAD